MTKDKTVSVFCSGKECEIKNNVEIKKNLKCNNLLISNGSCVVVSGTLSTNTISFTETETIVFPNENSQFVLNTTQTDVVLVFENKEQNTIHINSTQNIDVVFTGKHIVIENEMNEIILKPIHVFNLTTKTRKTKKEQEEEERYEVFVLTEFVIVQGNQMKVDEKGEIIIGEGNEFGL